MRLTFFEPRADAHIRKSREYLEEAHVRRVEHQAAAEHHGALTRMYADRITRLETEIREASKPRCNGGAFSEDSNNKDNAHSKTDSVVPYPSRASHA